MLYLSTNLQLFCKLWLKKHQAKQYIGFVVLKGSSFRVILAHVTWPRAQPLGQSVSLKFSLETRLESSLMSL